MSLAEITSQIKQKMTLAGGLKAKVLFDLGDDGILFVDTNENPAVIEENPNEPETDLTLTTDKATFEGILNGTQDPNIAFMMGKLKIKGSMALALKLNAILED